MIVAVAADTTAFAEWLDRELTEREWSNARFAERIGASTSTVQAWRRKGVRPSDEMCRRVADALNADRDYVLALADYRPVNDISDDADDRWPVRPSDLSRADREYLARLMRDWSERPVQPDESHGPGAH